MNLPLLLLVHILLQHCSPEKRYTFEIILRISNATHKTKDPKRLNFGPSKRGEQSDDKDALSRNAYRAAGTHICFIFNSSLRHVVSVNVKYRGISVSYVQC